MYSLVVMISSFPREEAILVMKLVKLRSSFFERPSANES